MSMADFYMWLPRITTLLFIGAFGASVGSLINVLVYRLPLGMGVVTPASRCPACDRKLTWRENIPIFGWLILKGRCRFCNSKISPEYPIVESVVAILFMAFWALWYVVPDSAGFWASIRPEWALNDVQSAFPTKTWPAMVVLLMLVGSLVAMTIVDAKTYTIPLVLAWVPLAIGVIGHTGHALWFELSHGVMEQASSTRWVLPDRATWTTPDGSRWLSEIGWQWTITTPDTTEWRWIGAALGGVLGLIVANALVALGLVRRSFADYDEWEAKALAERQVETPGTQQPTEGDQESEPAPLNTQPQESAADLWIQYPHARREMVKEMAFLAPVVGLAIVGAWLLNPVGGPLAQTGAAPLWLAVLAGSLLGALAGGGVVWAVRILGSIAFGKEAMGLGDVHLMAAVGACLGWIDPVIAFFGAAFVGVAWALLGAMIGGGFKRAMPYGPFLAIATLMVLLGKPWIEVVLAKLSGAPGPLSLP